MARKQNAPVARRDVKHLTKPRKESTGSGASSKVAESLLARGLCVIPVPYGAKAPILKEWQKLRLTAITLPEHFNGRSQNVGVHMGEPSGWVVDIDLDHSIAVQLAPSFLPETKAIFGRKGKPRSHYLYRCLTAPTLKYPLKNDERDMLVELRSTGHQTIFPGSTHPSGEPIEWESDGEPAAISTEELSRCTGRLASACLLTLHWPGEGSRHLTALAVAGMLLQFGFDYEDAENFLTVVVEAAGDNELQDRLTALKDTYQKAEAGKRIVGLPRLKQIVGRDVGNKLKEWLGPRAPHVTMGCTDTDNGERFARHHGDDVRYVYEFKGWKVWDNCRWADDSRGEVFRRAQETARAIITEAQQEKGQRHTELLKHAVASQARGRLEAMVWAAQPELALSPDELDTHPHLFNVANGTLDLRTGHLRPHNRDDFLTKVSPIVYAPGAECPVWLAFLDRIMSGDTDTITFLQRAIGYALTGETSEQCFFLLHGSGSNGKSTLLETLQLLFGDYARPTEFRTLLHREHSDAVRNDLAMLRGLRLVSAVEVGKGKRFDEGLVKTLTGSDTITARFLHKEFFDFRPTFKLFLAANHKPHIRGVDEGIWRRVRLIPFDVTITAAERDKHLPAKLRAELPGILAWAVRGCLDWQREGLPAPQRVVAATAEYRNESDILGDFIEGLCDVGPDRSVSAAELYSAYERWAEEAGMEPLAKNVFGSEMKDRGYNGGVQKVESKATRMYIGISLRPDVRDTKASKKMLRILKADSREAL